MSVELSAASLAALITAPIAGLGLLSARMLGRSGRIGLTMQTLGRSKADIIVIVVYDVVGAVVAILGLVLLGVSKPSPLISYFDTDPLITWAVFGVLGPVCAVGILDRLPVIRFVDISRMGADSQQIARLRDTLSDGVALRRKAVERIVKCHYEDIEVVEGTERRNLYHLANRLIQEERLGFDDLAQAIEKYVKEYREGEMPEETGRVMEQRKAWPADENMFLNAEKLLGVALDAGLSRPVNIACRLAEAPPPPENTISNEPAKA